MSTLAFSSILRAHANLSSRSSVSLVSHVSGVGNGCQRKIPAHRPIWGVQTRSYSAKNDDLDNMSSYDKSMNTSILVYTENGVNF